MAPGGTHMPSGDSGGYSRGLRACYSYRKESCSKIGKNWKLGGNGY
jgi:hypothetical protein